MIKIEPYKENWSSDFLAESEKIKREIKNSNIANEIIEIHHVGSTSIPGCDAKPIIDILIVLRTMTKIADLVNILTVLQYTQFGKFNIWDGAFFKRNDSFNLHLYPINHPRVSRLLTFKRWLTSHPEDRIKYVNLKRSLSSNKRGDYSDGKELFEAEILNKAGLVDIRLDTVLCGDSEEDKQGIRDFEAALIAREEACRKTQLFIRNGLDIIGYAIVFSNDISSSVFIHTKTTKLCDNFNHGKVIFSYLRACLKSSGMMNIQIDLT